MDDPTTNESSIEVIEFSSCEGLTVTYNEAESLITLDWDPDLHPEYNYFEDLSSTELFAELMNCAASEQ